MCDLQVPVSISRAKCQVKYSHESVQFKYGQTTCDLFLNDFGQSRLFNISMMQYVRPCSAAAAGSAVHYANCKGGSSHGVVVHNQHAAHVTGKPWAP
jgi:UDP-N-acetylenolpyruvoylglucosamine reductase